MEKETITITLEEYQKLVADGMKLDALEAAGVDNWDGHEHAMDILREWQEDAEEN